MRYEALVTGAVVACAAAPALSQVFTTRTDWVTAAGGDITTPDYSTFGEIDFVPGSPTDLGGFFSVTAAGGATGDASLNSVPNFVFDFAPGGLSSVTFTFDAPITAFAALWSNTFVQDGFSVSTPEETYDLHSYTPTLNAQFIGFVESSGFTTVTFTTTSPMGGGGDDFVFFREFEFAAVPSPSGAALLALAGVGAARRRRR